MAGILSIKIRANATSFERTLKTVGRDITAFSQKALAIGRGISLGFTAPLMAIGATAVNTAADFDGLERSLKTIMGSTAAAAQEMEKLKVAARLPGLGFEQAVKGSVQLQAVGINADQSRKILINFGTALSVVNKGAEELSAVNLQFTQMISKNRILAEDFKPIQSAVPQVGEALQNAFGTKNVEAIRDTGISAKDFVMRLTDAIGALDSTKNATGGLRNDIDNFRDSLRYATAELGKAILKNIDLEGILEKITRAITDLLDYWSGLSDGMKSAIFTAIKFVAVGGSLLWIIGQIASAIGTTTHLMGDLVKNMMYYDKVTGLITIKTGGWVTIALAAAAAIGYLAYQYYEANKPIELFNDYVSASAKNLIAEKAAMNASFQALQSHKISSQAREKILENIIAKYGQYLPNLDKEKSSLKEINEAQKKGNLLLDEKIKLLTLEGVVEKQSQAVSDSILKEIELTKKLNDLNKKSSSLNKKDDKGLVERLANAIPSAITTQKIGSVNEQLVKTKANTEQLTEALKKSVEELNKLYKTPPVTPTGDDFSLGGGGGKAEDIKKLQTEYQKLQEKASLLAEKYQNVVYLFGEMSPPAFMFKEMLVGVNKELETSSKALENIDTTGLEKLENKAEELTKKLKNAIYDQLDDTEVLGIALELKKVNSSLEYYAKQLDDLSKDNSKDYYDRQNEQLGELTQKYKNVVAQFGETSEAAGYLAHEIQILIDKIKETDDAFNNIGKNPLDNAEKEINDLKIAFAKAAIENGVFSKEAQDLKSKLNSLYETTDKYKTLIESAGKEHFLTRMGKDADKATAKAKEDLENFIDIKNKLATSIEEAVGNLGEQLGNALSGKGFSIGDVLVPIADMLIDLGKLAIKAGLAVEALKQTFKSFKGFGAVLAGVALVALGSFVKAKAAGIPKLAKGGLAYAPTMAMVGDNKNASVDPEVIAPLSKLKSMLGEAGSVMPYILETRVSGSDLIFMMQRANNVNARIR